MPKNIALPRRGRALLAPAAAALALVVALGTASAAPANAAPAAPQAKPVAAAPAGTDPGPAGDAFYTPPSPLPAGKPGDVIRARPAKAGPPAARALADAWQVMYLSTNALGKPVAVTGMVLVPKNGDPAKAPVVGFGPGTSGPAFRCAPSRFVDQGAFYEQSAINEMLQAGYAVAETDYEGYHENPTTTYVVNSMGYDLIDAVRAAQRLPEAGLSPDAPVAFRGYSQGGAAAMWAGQKQPGYAPELKLTGVVGGGVPSDLAAVGAPLEGAKPFGFLLYSMVGMDNAYPELKLASYANDAGKAMLADFQDNVCTLELLLGYQGKTVPDYFTSSPYANEDWLARVAENTLGADPIKAPVFQYHSTADEIVAFGQAKELRDNYCRLGVQETWKTWDKISHITLVYRGNQDAMAFLADRFAGKPATSNC
ncbi:lipase family protein [Actinomadura opuntiae]|uniref:lipase family protein n=1 Tax=Actinomadura sp. OS1-43 TaxID=604315 RepID=UPI00255A8694|nr:lipase family protein [Actinomadura sp. OS1-43]MDL4818434.1 lipase family protein [Actinomadura sp. OS1-43]